MIKEKQKDPSFLMYSKDWLEGTADMMPDEKGVFIDLLCHQHQKGVLPSDLKRLSKLVGLNQSDFLPIWQHLKSKFKAVNGSSLVNHKLTTVVAERKEYTMQKKIAGEFAYLLREGGFTEDKINKIKKQFRTDDFVHLLPENVRPKIKEWLAQW